jgi:hypothetical protein
MRTFLVLILLMLLLIGCQPASPKVATIQPTISPQIFTESASQVFPPKPTSAEGKIPKHDETIQPSRTPAPSLTPSTPTPSVTFLELPAWVKNPASQIVLFEYQTDRLSRSSEIGFLNAASGEQAIVHLPYELYQYYWKDANHIVFLQGYCGEPLVQVTELDIPQGTLSPATPENLPGHIAHCYGLEDASSTMNIDTHPNDGTTDVGFLLSPNKDYLGVVQVQGKFDFPELWQPLFGTQVSVYYLPDRKLVASFAEEKAVSAELLFTDNENLVYVRQNTPCVISIVNVSKKCIHAISDWFPKSTIILGDPLKDQKKLNFIYFGNSPHQGGWCIYDLFSGAIDCPTDEFQDLQGQVVTNYALSPDNHYLLIEYDDKGCPVPWCDDFGGPQIALIDIPGRKFFKLGDSETYQAMDDSRAMQPWRPVR